MSMEHYWSIEGNIGAGKTTLLDRLIELRPDIKPLFEPVDTWNAIEVETGDGLLEAFYEDQKKFAFLFQTTCLITRARLLKEWMKSGDAKRPTIQERCLLSDRETFVLHLLESGALTDAEYRVLSLMYDHLSEECPRPIFFYIDTPPVLCLDRVRARMRVGEEHVTIDYLTSLDEKLRRFALRNSDRVIVLDGRHSTEELARQVLRCIDPSD